MDPRPTENTPETPAERYRKRAARFHADAAAQGRRVLRLSTLRLLAFVAGVALLLAAYDAAPPMRVVLLLAGIALMTAFGVLVSRHARARREQRWLEQLALLNEEGLARLGREWARLPAPEPLAEPGHPYAADLDVLGRASLAQLLGTVSTAPGRATLRRWLLSPAPPPEVRERQESVAELAPLVELRESLAALGRLGGVVDARRVEEFAAWGATEPRTGTGWLLRWAAWLLPAATLVLGVLRLAGVLHAPWWGIPVLVAAVISWRHSPAAHREFAQASLGQERLAHYAELFALIGGTEYHAALLRRVREALAGTGTAGPAAVELRRLQRIVGFATARFTTMLYLPLQLLLMWDFHVLRALEHWRRRAGRAVAGWMKALGAADALAALAALAHDHPDWAFPELVEAGPRTFRAEALGHPLLPPAAAVRNDVTVGPAGTFLLVTGSNMSGKSTLLRAIGVNAVLAQTGAPVCARRLSMPPLRVWTSMRVSDSLERGVSHFMAELERLKQIVDASRELEGDPEWTLLYLVDEVLQGTNSAERQVAARHIIRHLVDRGAIGAVTTHDLELGEAEDLGDSMVPVHFRETVNPAGEGPALTFDYRLRPGVATSRNALKLMEIVGLGDGA